MVIRVENPLRTMIDAYTADDIDFLEFEGRFVSRAWNIIAEEDSPDANMADEVFCLLIDFRDSCITESDLKESLRRLNALDAAGNPVSSMTVSSAVPVKPVIRSFGKRLATAPA